MDFRRQVSKVLPLKVPGRTVTKISEKILFSLVFEAQQNQRSQTLSLRKFSAVPPKAIG